MALEDQQQEKNATPSLNGRGAARRRLTRAGAAAVLTLGSRGALAQVPTSLTPSGYWSSGLNPAVSHRGQEKASGGRRPDQWACDTDSWPHDVHEKTTLFTYAFPSAAKLGVSCSNGSKNNGWGSDKDKDKNKNPAPTSYSCALLSEMLTQQSFDQGSLGMYMAATYLNIRAGLITFLTVSDLRQIWDDVSPPGGVYHPTAGVNWYRADVVKYLQATMI